MKPSEFSNQLRHIATAIDNSKNPNKDLVANDLHKLLATLEGSTLETPAVTVPEQTGLSPEAAAEQIRNIATKLANSKNPRRDLVVQDIKNIISQLKL